MSLSLDEYQLGLDSVTTPFGRDLLHDYAVRNGETYLRLYQNKFPVAIKANEQPKHNMNLTLNITADQQIIDALNNIATSFRGNCTAATTATVSEVVAEEETPAAPAAPKKGKAAPKPASVKPAPVIEEPEEEPFTLTGVDLVGLLAPIKGTDYTKELKSYKDTQLGLADTQLKDVTDVSHLKKLHVKIIELVEKKQAADAKAAEEEV